MAKTVIKAKRGSEDTSSSEETAAPDKPDVDTTQIDQLIADSEWPAVKDILTAIKESYKSSGDLEAAIGDTRRATPHWPAEMDDVIAKLEPAETDDAEDKPTEAPGYTSSE